METNLNFEAESFHPSERYESEFGELPIVRDHRTGTPVVVRRDQTRPGARVVSAPPAAVRGWQPWRPGTSAYRPHTAYKSYWSHGRPYYRDYRGGVYNASRPYWGHWSNWQVTHPTRRWWEHRPEFRRRWPWLFNRWRGVGTAVTTPIDTGVSGAVDTSFGTAVAAPPTIGMGGLAPAEDPHIVGWAQSCLGKIIGGWVPQDGVLGPATRRAIAMFQKGAQVPPSGTLDDSTLSALQQACQQSAQPDASGITGASPPEAPSMPTPDMSVVVPPPGAPSTPTAPEQPKEFEWESEWEDRPSGPQPPRVPQRRSCEPDRCTSPYIRWLQSSLNSVAGANIKVTGMMDDPTMAAVNRFRISRKLNANESYHIGPVIEQALINAGASQPPTVPASACGPSDPRKLIPIIDSKRGDIPLEVLLGWIDVESAWVLEPPSVTCERGFFQLMPEDSVILHRDHDRVGTDPVYSIEAGIELVNRARASIEPVVKAFGIPRNTELHWRLVKLWHWIPSGPAKILASMSAQGQKATDWAAIRNFVSANRSSLTKLIRRDPKEGLDSVDNTFRHIEAWRKRLNP